MASDSQLDVAFVIGNHPFDARAVIDALHSFDDLSIYPQDLPTFVSDIWEQPTAYDAAVFYNFHGNGSTVTLSDDVYERSLATIPDLGDAGVGIVPLHHGILAFPDSGEWAEVTGVGDHENNVSQGEELTVEVADPGHPVTEGLSDWVMTDETYDVPEPDDDSEVLLRTAHPRSLESLAWTRQYRDARVVCYQSGHDETTFSTPQFRSVLGRSIRWVVP